MNISAESDHAVSKPGNWRQTMRQHPLFFFFLLAYAISWILSIPAILFEWGILTNAALFYIFFTVKSFGPFLAAVIMIRLTDGNAGMLEFRRRIKLWRVGWQWYAFVLLGMPALMLLGIIMLPGALASYRELPPFFLANALISFVLIFFGGGPLGEEPGWRGFALPRLLQRYSVLRANLILGALWTFWHLPDFLTSAQGGGPQAGLSPFYTRLPIFFLMVLALTFIFTWVFQHTGGSIFIALLLHTAINAFAGAALPLFPAPIVTNTDLPFLIPMVALAFLIFLFTRGKPGYSSSQDQDS
jgi:membrane protease YdiL (CAAX protease family)